MFRSQNIQYVNLKIKRKIRNYLLSAKSRDFLIFLFFFLIAFGFWLLQTLNNDFQTEFSLPLRLKDVPNNVVVTSEIPENIQVTVRDKGTVLLNYIVSQNFTPVTIDFSEYNTRRNHIRLLSPELGRLVSSQLGTSTTLINVNPDTLDIIFTTGKPKKLPVRLRGNIHADRQYYITDTIFFPDSVTIYAPDAIRDTMQYAYTRRILLDGVSDTTRRTLEFMEIKGVKYIPNTVDITFPVDIITEKTLEVSLIPIDFPRNRVLRTFPSKVKVSFHVGLNRFKTITPEDFVIVVPYEDLINNTSDKYRLELQSFPSDVTYPRIVPQEIDYLIEQYDD